jgi:cation transport ATPase
MNANLLNVVKEIVTQYGEQVLSEPKRVSAFFADLAKDEPKPQKNALVKCLEHGFVQILKNAAEPDRALCKQQLAQKLHEEEGLDLGLCGDTLELLAAVLFGEQLQKRNLCKNCGKELQEGWKSCPYCSTSAASISTISASNISGNSQQTNQVNYSQEVQAVTGVVKKNELTSLRILSIIGLFSPIWFFLGNAISTTFDFFYLIMLVVFSGFFIAHLILALVKGKKYNLKTTKVMAIIGIILFVLFILNIFMEVIWC